MAPLSEQTIDALDLQLIAQRILQLAQLATAEHLNALANSQAQGILQLACETENG